MEPALYPSYARQIPNFIFNEIKQLQRIEQYAIKEEC